MSSLFLSFFLWATVASARRVVSHDTLSFESRGTRNVFNASEDAVESEEKVNSSEQGAIVTSDASNIPLAVFWFIGKPVLMAVAKYVVKESSSSLMSNSVAAIINLGNSITGGWPYENDWSNSMSFYYPYPNTQDYLLRFTNEKPFARVKYGGAAIMNVGGGDNIHFANEVGSTWMGMYNRGIVCGADAVGSLILLKNEKRRRVEPGGIYIFTNQGCEKMFDISPLNSWDHDGLIEKEICQNAATPLQKNTPADEWEEWERLTEEEKKEKKLEDCKKYLACALEEIYWARIPGSKGAMYAIEPTKDCHGRFNLEDPRTGEVSWKHARPGLRHANGWCTPDNGEGGATAYCGEGGLCCEHPGWWPGTNAKKYAHKCYRKGCHNGHCCVPK